MAHFLYLDSKLAKKNKKEIHLINMPFFLPKEYKKIYIVSYLFLVPYILGSIFVFFYLHNGNIDLFLSLDLKKFFIFTWAIGCEIAIVSSLLYLFIQYLISRLLMQEKNTRIQFSKV